MEEENLDVFVVPTTDPHNSEYTPEHWKVRQWLTGFDGSAGIAVVTMNNAALWTDSRYFIQAEKQLKGTAFILMRDGLPDTPSISDWIMETLPEGGSVGYFNEMMTQELCESIFGTLSDIFEIVSSESDPYSLIWLERPEIPAHSLEVMPEEMCGMTVAEKLRIVFDAVTVGCRDVKYILINDLSEIAWMLNLRGSDIEYNPVFVSYLLLGQRHATLFTNEKHITQEIKHYLLEMGVSVKRYKGWKNFIDDATMADVLAFPPTMNLRVVEHCRACGIPFHFVSWPVPQLRARKTIQEQEGFRKAMERDGVAMVQFLRWLEKAVPGGNQTEYTVAEKLTQLRSLQEGFKGLSFSTISGYGSNGAIVHYEAKAETAEPLRPEGLLLLDSGAHYDCGTTDITRTIALGPVSTEERRAYTLVLKGHIALSRCRFPEGTTGIQLDLAARYAMWQEGYDYGHGTGHGVGHRLCVHEGPQQIRKNLRQCTSIPFSSGMTITNEPGIYVSGHFGVRIENVLLIVENGETPFGKFLSFEPLTLCPIDMSPVDYDLLTDIEIGWINDYHAFVRERLLPHLSDDEDREWLFEKTKTISH